MTSDDKDVDEDVWAGSDDELEKTHRDKEWNKLEDRFMDVSLYMSAKREDLLIVR